jgi:hypothetical protein
LLFRKNSKTFAVSHSPFSSTCPLIFKDQFNRTGNTSMGGTGVPLISTLQMNSSLSVSVQASGVK